MSQPTLKDFYERSRTARKILVVDLGFLGDSVHLVPALWEIKRHYPAAELHTLSAPVGAEVLQLAPCVDRPWAFPLTAPSPPWWRHWDLLLALRRERFDLAFNFSGADRTVFITALTGARWRVAHAAGRKHFWGPWLIPNWVPRREADMRVFEQHRQVLAACGFKLEPARFGLKVGTDSSRWAADIVHPFTLHLSLNSSKSTREWPLEYHVTLLRTVWAEYPDLRVLASGSGKERERQRLRSLAAMVNDSRFQILPESLSISQLAALLTRCRLHIGPDSGVLHLAVALGVPTISFFREQGNYESFLPNGPKHRVITMPCHCIDHRNAPCEQLGVGECFAQIKPARVAVLVQEQLGA